MNGEGYRDPTADKAIGRINQMSHKMREALYALRAIASLLGFEIVVVRDKRTGKEYR